MINIDKRRENQRRWRSANPQVLTPAQREQHRKKSLEWYRRNRDRVNEQRRAHRLVNLDEIRKRERSSRAKNPERTRRNKLKYLYGITPEAVEAMLIKQGNACAVCHTDKWGSHGPVVDHNHASKKVRGILCQKCNLALGAADDDPARLRAMATYAEREGSC
jgi:hypothetical protein